MKKRDAVSGDNGSGLPAPKQRLQGELPRLNPLADFARMRQALVNELHAAQVAGLNAPGVGVDAHRHRVLVERSPDGEVKIVKRLRPFRWTAQRPTNT